MISDSAWRDGGRLLFGRMYEDVAIERAAFPVGGRTFSVASAGCTALDLATDREVVACDINPAQIDYVKRRLAGGPIEAGAADRVMSVVRSLKSLAGWTDKKLRRFLALAEPEAQLTFWHDQLDTWRLRQGLDVLLSRACLRAAYSSEFLQCLPTRFGSVLRGRMRRSFGRHPNYQNPYARRLVLGDSAASTPAVEPLPQLELVVADAAEYLEGCPAETFSAFSLSNITDGAPSTYRSRLFAAVRRAATKDAIVVMRSFSEPTRVLSVDPSADVAASTSEYNRAADDRTMLWGIVDVCPADTL